jgi:hypothetical protein
MATVEILLSCLGAKCAGLAVLHHLQAWATVTYLDRLESETCQPEPRTWRDYVCPDCHAHPFQCGDVQPSPANSETVRHHDDLTVRYQNGDAVTDNQAEIQAFTADVKAEKEIPPDRDKLREWVRNTPTARINVHAPGKLLPTRGPPTFREGPRIKAQVADPRPLSVCQIITPAPEANRWPPAGL